MYVSLFDPAAQLWDPMDLSLNDRHCEMRLMLNPDSLGDCMSGSRLKSHNIQDVPLVECVIRGLQGTGGIKLRQWFMVWLICTGIRLAASPSLQHVNGDLRTYYYTQAVTGCRMKMRPSPRVAWRTNCAAGLPQGEFQRCLMHYDFSLTSLQCVSFSLYRSLFSSLQTSCFLFRNLSFSFHRSSFLYSFFLFGSSLSTYISLYQWKPPSLSLWWMYMHSTRSCREYVQDKATCGHDAERAGFLLQLGYIHLPRRSTDSSPVTGLAACHPLRGWLYAGSFYFAVLSRLPFLAYHGIRRRAASGNVHGAPRSAKAEVSERANVLSKRHEKTVWKKLVPTFNKWMKSPDCCAKNSWNCWKKSLKTEEF